ncbi:hypothetical protein HFO77_25495 [Rhizobium leguminosarum]|uniref:hypothetical protein n=1 Tax=Rhizobium leguminosarum TaxID=384 RepID=UPI001C9608C1|nr:hypothetical protein [Rhizobium leguminosarum]MBY5917751.1 hypothetical protein [Rhizobium leguminosarum]
MNSIIQFRYIPEVVTFTFTGDMAKYDRPNDASAALNTIIALLQDFPESLATGTVGEQVCRLVEVHRRLRDLGVAVIAPLVENSSDSGRARLLAYLRNQVGRVVHTDELLIVAAITDYQRRIRELRAKFGWPIISGMAVCDMREDARLLASPGDRIPGAMAPEEYLLLEDRCDPDAIRRWKIAGSAREVTGPLKVKLLGYLQQAVGRRVTAEELRHVAKDDAGWPAAIRGLQHEGWPIKREAGNAAGLLPGLFILERGDRNA